MPHKKMFETVKCSTAEARLKRDYMKLKNEPLPYITAEPLPENMLEWHYVLKGPEDTPYEGGYYHGTLVFRDEFPFRPPLIEMITPNGRFSSNIRICMSIVTDDETDTWLPSMRVDNVLMGLMSLMVDDTPNADGKVTSEAVIKDLAQKSLEFNLKNKIFCELFPEIVEEIKQRLTPPIHDVPEKAALTGTSNEDQE